MRRRIRMRRSKYNSPLIERAEQAMQALRKDKRYSSDRLTRELAIEFTDRYESIAKVITAEENRISFSSGDWKNRDGFEESTDE